MKILKIIMLSCCGLFVAVSLLFIMVSGNTQTPAPPSNTQQVPLYTVRAYQGKIAVFRENNDKPEQVYDVMTAYFPESDQILLAKGIPAYSVPELQLILEDYIS